MEATRDLAEQSQRGQWKRPVLMGSLAVLGAVCLAGIGFVAYRGFSSEGCKDYTVQTEQFVVEYSEEYDYGEVLTVEYPVLSGAEDQVQERINEQMYETAMDRVNYWHFQPSEEVRAFQEDQFTIFCSDVTCDVTYHSQYLLSMDFYELYSAGNPVWNTNITERGLTVDLLTGEAYELTDILEVDRDFMELWGERYCEETGEEPWTDEELDLLLSWFLQQDEELKEDYESRPFFYVTEDKNFVIGLSLDPILYGAITYKPTSRIMSTTIEPRELTAFQTQSEFWNRLEKSQDVGVIFPCEDKQQNIWLGEGAGIWNYWDS